LFKRVAATEVKALCKKQTTLEDRIASDTNYFHKIQTKRKFADASYEPHYAVAGTSDFSAHFQDGSAKQSVILCFCTSSKKY